MRIHWHGPRHYRKGRLEIGRVWLAWRGWSAPTAFNIGRTRVFSVGPIAVFVDPHARTTERPSYCCGKCPPIAGGGYDCTCRGNPQCATGHVRLRDLEFDRLDILKLRIMRATVCRVFGHRFRRNFSGSICTRCRNFQPR